VCDIAFEERYGEIGKGFMHLHHKRPLAALGRRYRLNAVKDLVPICPNCHAMLDKREPPYDVGLVVQKVPPLFRFDLLPQRLDPALKYLSVTKQRQRVNEWQ
jgi:hypothetical protein